MPFFPQIGAKVLQISLESIKLKSCACTQIKALAKWNWWLYPDDGGYSSESVRNAADLKSGGGGLFCSFFLKLVSWVC